MLRLHCTIFTCKAFVDAKGLRHFNVTSPQRYHWLQLRESRRPLIMVFPPFCKGWSTLNFHFVWVSPLFNVLFWAGESNFSYITVYQRASLSFSFSLSLQWSPISFLYWNLLHQNMCLWCIFFSGPLSQISFLDHHRTKDLNCDGLILCSSV